MMTKTSAAAKATRPTKSRPWPRPWTTRDKRPAHSNQPGSSKTHIALSKWYKLAGAHFTGEASRLTWLIDLALSFQFASPHLTPHQESSIMLLHIYTLAESDASR